MSETSTLIGYQGKTIDRSVGVGPDTFGDRHSSTDPTSRNRYCSGRNIGLSTHRRGARRVRCIAGWDEDVRCTGPGDRDAWLPLLDWGPELARQEHAARNDVW